MNNYQVTVVGWIEANSVEEAEELYADGEWEIAYHDIEEDIYND